MAEPILKLDTLVERRVILIRTEHDQGDGKPYELRSPQELSILDYHRAGKKAERVDELAGLAPEQHTEDTIKELESLVDWLCAFVLLAPDEVRTRLRYDQKLRVAQAFMDLQRDTPPRPAAEGGQAATSTGENSSPG